MTHYLLLKFEPGYMSQELFLFATETFEQLQKELSEIRSVHISRNCITRDTNADLLVELELSGQEALDAYLEHPIHRDFARVTEPYVCQRSTFDRA